MRRWLPYVLVVLGLAGLVSGWLLYPSHDPNGDSCSVQVLYRSYIQGTGELANGYACSDGTFTLYASLALLLAGALLLLSGWIWAVPRHAARITTRLPAQALAAVLLFALVVIGAGGRFGWQKYQDHRDTQRLHVAERALAAMTMPASWTGPTRPNRCAPNAVYRCAHSVKAPAALTAELIALVHGHATTQCPPRRTLFPCSVQVTGRIAGYPAIASAQPDLYFASENHPASAVRLHTRTQRPVYVDGSVIYLSLLTPEE